RNREEIDLHDSEFNDKMHAFVCSRSSPLPFEDSEGNTTLSKNPAAFTSPVKPESQAAYGYGHQVSLVSAVSGNAEIPLRPYDPRQIFMVAGFQTGSCPFLYARYSDDPEPVKIGRVFRLANRPERSAIYERDFDRSLEELVLAEEEAE